MVTTVAETLTAPVGRILQTPTRGVRSVIRAGAWIAITIVYRLRGTGECDQCESLEAGPHALPRP